jgi:hypothetical protein
MGRLGFSEIMLEIVTITVRQRSRYNLLYHRNY